MTVQASLLSLLCFSLLAASCSGAGYVLDWEAKGTTFFDKFKFITINDPSQGFVNYVNQSYAQAKGLISVVNGQVKIDTDHTNVVANGSRGRDSVRIESKQLFNGGLFIADLVHMPTGCGTWPAWWLWGYPWPTTGEIDIIEGLHERTQDNTALHTNAGCEMASVWTNSSSVMTGTPSTTNCTTTGAGGGCGVKSEGNYGAAFNNVSGGVYILEWAQTHLKVWYFRRSLIPADVKAGTPNPSGWGMPIAYFGLGANCPPTHFRNHTMTINLTFCGAWAGQAWPTEAACKNLATTCNDYVRNNPSAFAQAYWLFNSVRVYQWSATGGSSGGNDTSSASRPTSAFSWA